MAVFLSVEKNRSQGGGGDVLVGASQAWEDRVCPSEAAPPPPRAFTISNNSGLRGEALSETTATSGKLIIDLKICAK
jgi:hypothetical protein